MRKARRWRHAGVMGSVVALLGCGDGRVTIHETGPSALDGCFQPLQSFCATHLCPSYSDSAAEVRAFAASPGCMSASVGTCGEYRYTLTGSGFTSTTLYFDAEGTVLAARTTTDVILRPYSACPGWSHYGQRVSCTTVPLEAYCPR
jgi:hypothetical protein